MDEQATQPNPRFQSIQKLAARLRRILPFTAGITAALLGLILYNSIFANTPQLTNQDVQDAVAQALASATPPAAYSAQVYQAVQPSLVLIQTRTAEDEEHGSLGSGVIVNANGEILTSLHVVEDAAEILLTFADGTQSGADIAATQPENDIAVLVPHTLPSIVIPAVLGNPDSMRVGDEAYAVGNPFGLYGSMSAGVISGFERTFEPPNDGIKLEGLIQIDAAVNLGNSGGPLLNRAGQVIGIVVGIVNPTDGEFFIGIGFAVPITIAGGAAGMPSY